MSNFAGMKISKPGVDVKDASDNELIFNSDYPLFKIHKQGSGVLSVNPVDTLYTVDIPHSTGIVPMYFVWSEVFEEFFVKSAYFKPLPYSFYTFAGQSIAFRPLMDTSKLRLEFDLTLYWFGTDTIKYFYVIFEDPKSDA